jgi:hypothetical protein
MTNPGAPGQVKSEIRMSHDKRAAMAHSGFGLGSSFRFLVSGFAALSPGYCAEDDERFLADGNGIRNHRIRRFVG